MAAIEAWSRLRSQSVGRLALTEDGRPDIFPVNYLADDQRILIKTGAGRKLDMLTANSNVAFEVDQVALDLVWSVVIQGTARELTEPVELASVRQAAFWTWPARQSDRFIEVRPDTVVGRSFLRH